MKKWLIRCLTVLAMVCLIPGIVLKAAAETVPVYCAFCGIREEREVRRYEKYDSAYHKVCVDACQNCHKDGNVTHLQVHTGGTQGPTCTEGKICEDCGAEYDIPGHAWGEWNPNGDGTHTRICTNPNCDAKEENVPCGGDPNATCITKGKCTTCKGQYDGGHDLVHHEAKAATCLGTAGVGTACHWRRRFCACVALGGHGRSAPAQRATAAVSLPGCRPHVARAGRQHRG